MLKLNCLIKNTVAIEHIKNAIQMIVGSRIESSGIATFPEVYNDLRRMGVEIDAESAGALYDGIYGSYDDASVSSSEEVAEFAGADFARQLGSVIENIYGEGPEVRTDELGRLSPEKFAVTAISKLFEKATFAAPPKLQTTLRKMQDFITKAATSTLPKTANKGASLTDALDAFFDVDSNSFRTLSGQLNTMQTLHDAVKKEVKNYVDQAAGVLTEEEEELLRQQWDKYTEAFINSTYDIILSKGNQNSLVNESLKQIKVDGVHIVDINGNVKWSALIDYGNPDTIVQKVKELFEDGFTAKDGTVTHYKADQAEKIGEYFKRLYQQKLQDAQQRLQQNNRVKNKSAKNIISDFIKDRGFFNLVKDKDGKLLLTQADWTNVIKFVRAQLESSDVGRDEYEREIRGMDLIKNRLRKFLDSQKNPDGTPKFTAGQKNLIENEMVDTIIAKLDPGVNEVTAIERLMALNAINNGGAFNNETQQAVNKVVGVSDLNQNVLNQLQQLTQLAHSILAGSNVTVGTTSAPDVNRGAYAYTALVEIDRKIKEILRQHKIENSSTQRVVKYMADLMGGGTVSLLLNPNNMIENVSTQFATNMGESINLMFTNPKLFFKTFGRLQGDFWTQWLNYAQGGASNEITNESDLSSDLQSSERLRVRGLINEFKGTGPVDFMKDLAGAVMKAPGYVVSIFSRVFMNSFDAATTTSLMRKRMIQTTYNSLVNQGNSPSDVLKLMDRSFSIPPVIAQQIEVENRRIENLLRGAGFPVNRVMMDQNKRDMRLSVYEDILRDSAATAGASVKQASEVTKALLESSQAQAKSLGGKRQLPARDILSSVIYGMADGMLKPQKYLFNAAKEAEKDGNLKRAGRLQFAGSIYQNFIGKFIGGVANFMNLAITATPLGFVTGGQLLSQRNQYATSNPGAADIFNSDPEQLKKYAELHGLMRSVFTRAAMGSVIMAAFIAKSLAKGGDDDDEEDADGFFNNLMQTKTGRRFIQKHLPLGIAMSAPYLYNSDANDDGVERFLNMVQVYTGSDFNTMSNLKRGLKYAKTPEDKEEVWGKFAGGIFTTYNVNQPEQFIKFKDVLQSAFNKDKISTVRENEAISRAMYKDVDGAVDAFFINGIIDALKRASDPDKKYNRFAK